MLRPLGCSPPTTPPYLLCTFAKNQSKHFYPTSSIFFFTHRKNPNPTMHISYLPTNAPKKQLRIFTAYSESLMPNHLRPFSSIQFRPPISPPPCKIESFAQVQVAPSGGRAPGFFKPAIRIKSDPQAHPRFPDPFLSAELILRHGSKVWRPSPPHFPCPYAELDQGFLVSHKANRSL